MGEDVLVENELSNDYSIEDADPDADAGLIQPEEIFEPDDSLFADDGLGMDDEF